MKDLLKYDDTQIFKYDNLVLAVIYTIGHIFVAMACNRIITGASLDMAAADAFIEPIINGFWFYFLLVFLKKIIQEKLDKSNSSLSKINVGIYLAVIYTIGHILIAMTCNRLLTGASLNLAAIDALIEPMVNGVWFFLLFEGRAGGEVRWAPCESWGFFFFFLKGREKQSARRALVNVGVSSSSF